MISGDVTVGQNRRSNKSACPDLDAEPFFFIVFMQEMIASNYAESWAKPRTETTVVGREATALCDMHVKRMKGNPMALRFRS